MLGHLFCEGGKGAIGGPWPRSRAYYGVDVLLDDAPFLVSGDPSALPVPKLVEVNFMADWDVAALALKQYHCKKKLKAAEARLESSVPAAAEQLATVEGAVCSLSDWANDMITLLATDEDVSTNPRLTRLSFDQS
mmetsp:Transcript_79887/g.159506  ORF Transcript_79887/g.159506 Transcript_79887/m.159506 type:complete len:135 (+) Transcript_79887:230-634(+)